MKMAGLGHLKIDVVESDEGPYFRMTEGTSRSFVRIDFSPRRQIGIKSDLLARAIGYKKNAPAQCVLDATAGLCRDSFHMACLGCKVVALETNEMIFQVVSKHVERLPEKYDLSLVQANAQSYIPNLETPSQFDVIYLDPMFPEKKKSARSGKESELLKALAPICSIEEEVRLVQAALDHASQRVVVKRPLYAPAILPRPDIQFKGKAVRYDVYLV